MKLWLIACCSLPVIQILSERKCEFVHFRGAIDVNHPAFGIAAPQPEQRSEVEEKSQYSQPGHHPFRQVYSRTYAILENQLEESERGGKLNQWNFMRMESVINSGYNYHQIAICSPER